jgi:hypothetical protein
MTTNLAASDKWTLRNAMLSAYYHAQAGQLTLRDRDAPAVRVPPELHLLDLADALETLGRWPDRLRDAIWRLVRATPVPWVHDDRTERWYPGELLDLVGLDWLIELDDRRRAARAGTQLLAAKLAACADRRWDEVGDLRHLLDGRAAGSRPGQAAQTMLAAMLQPRDGARVGQQLARLEEEVGLGIGELAEALADAVAFANGTGALGLWRSAGQGPTVNPVAAVVRQDARTLTTTAVATTVVQGELDALGRTIDPRCWPRSSEVVQTARLVGDAFALDPLPVDRVPAIGQGWDGARLLEETAAISWGGHASQQAWFHNVLRIDRFSVDHRLATIDLEFSLSRSIDSRVLWDKRAGGIVLDEGSVRVRPLAGHGWRVTGTKTLRFADRTPSALGSGWLGLGRVLNLLTPAALLRWLETDLSWGGSGPAADPEGAR